MHPIASHQIATLRASELRRQADRHNAHAPTRRSDRGDPAPAGPRSSLARGWAVLTRTPRAAWTR